MAAALPSRARSESSEDLRSRGNLLIRAIETEDLRALQLLLADELDVNASTTYGTTPLMIAAADGHQEMVRILTERGAAIDTTRGDGFTALALAVFFGHEEVVRQLLARGADLKASGRSATSPEMWAVARGFFRLGDLLRIAAEQRANSCSDPSEAAAISSSWVADEEKLLERSPANSITNVVDHPNSMDCNQDKETTVVELDETAAEIKAAREVDSVVPFSPFAAAIDRLGTNRGFLQRVGILRGAAQHPLNSSSEVTLVSEPAVSEPAINFSSVAGDEESIESPLVKPPANSTTNASNYPTRTDSNGYREITTVELDEAAAEIKAAREVDSFVPFSPFMSIIDRLGTNRMPAAVVLMFSILATGVAYTVFKALKRRPPSGNSTVILATRPSAKPEQGPALVAQPAPLAPAHTANAAAERASEEISSQSSDHTSSASTNGSRDEAASPKHAEAKQRVIKTLFSDANGTPKVTRRKSRQDEVLLTDNKGSSADATSSAPLAITPKPPTTQSRSTTTDVSTLPVEPIKGSSRKVIQWP